jgi:L-erythro-3,5-diaminohexanoate dehydrogenase
MGFRIEDGHLLGLQRVLNPSGVLAQAARVLDASLPPYSNEVLLAVDVLQIDAASFQQFKTQYQTPEAIAQAIMMIVTDCGKLQNPVTGSGGMLLGRVAAIGPDFPDKTLKVGERVASLISLTATPLSLTEVKLVEINKERALVSGHAILGPHALFARLPSDLPEGAALAGFDVCGAPADALRLTQPSDTVFILGLGKAGRSVAAAISRFIPDARILGIDAYEPAVEFCRGHYLGDFGLLDASDPVVVAGWIYARTNGKGADLTISCANRPDMEMAAILATRVGGRCLYFGMATNFQKAALGAESVGRDIRMLIGSGYVPGHAETMMQLLRDDKGLLHFFMEGFSL